MKKTDKTYEIDYFFNGDVKAFTNSTDHITTNLIAKTPMSFVRQVRKLLKQFESEAKLKCIDQCDINWFIVDRKMSINDIKLARHIAN